jgi:hypothetical protein
MFILYSDSNVESVLLTVIVNKSRFMLLNVYHFQTTAPCPKFLLLGHLFLQLFSLMCSTNLYS